MNDNEKRVLFLTDNYKNIVNAIAGYEAKYPGDKAFAIILTAITGSNGQICVLNEITFKQIFDQQKQSQLKGEIRDRWNQYRDSPLIIVETPTGTMRTSLINAELRAMMGEETRFVPAPVVSSYHERADVVRQPITFGQSRIQTCGPK